MGEMISRLYADSSIPLVNNKVYIALLVFGLNALFTPVTFAENLLLVPYLFSSVRNFEYSVTNGGVNGMIHSLGGGITGIYKNFYIDLAGEKDITAREESATNLLSTDRIAFNRTDFATSFGYAINESISVFGGYKYGKSTITALMPSPFVGGKITLEGKGLFIGAGGGWVLKNGGTLSFSAAYAKISSFYKDLAIGTTKGDAAGTSLSMKWKAALTKRLYYDFSLIRHDYYYEDFRKFDWDISEQILSYRIGLSYRF